MMLSIAFFIFLHCSLSIADLLRTVRTMSQRVARQGSALNPPNSGFSGSALQGAFERPNSVARSEGNIPLTVKCI